jgi:hypothetical protein
LTTTEVVVVLLHPLASVTVREYVPELAVVALAIDGLFAVELKLGPDHEYDVPPLPVKEMASPAQTGVFDDTVAVGSWFTSRV